MSIILAHELLLDWLNKYHFGIKYLQVDLVFATAKNYLEYSRRNENQ